jgi:hypothetical protein
MRCLRGDVGPHQHIAARHATSLDPYERARLGRRCIGHRRCWLPAACGTAPQPAGKYYRGLNGAAERSATSAVDAIRRANRGRREGFDGKKLIAALFKKHLHATPLSRPVFTFYAAKRARRRRSVQSFRWVFCAFTAVSARDSGTLHL